MPDTDTPTRPDHGYAYLHGFASSSAARKGFYLRQVFANRGVELLLPDLNVPSFETMTYDSILDELDRLDRIGEIDRSGGAGLADGTDRSGDRRWRLIGSSMGGYLAARWAELRPKRVDRVVLLCPGFDMAVRWPELIGAEAMARWESAGRIDLPDATGAPRAVHWGLIENARTHPPFPELPCPGLILHGTRDAVVDIESSREYARSRPGVRLVELDDDHSLGSSMARIARESLSFFGDDSRLAEPGTGATSG